MMACVALRRSNWTARILLIRVNAAQNFRRCCFAAMTIQTPPHRERSNLFNPVHTSDIAMAGFTRNSLQHVTFVGEIYEIRQFMHANPFDRFLFVVELLELLDIRAIRLHHLMAVHANVHGGNSGMPGLVGSRMTVETRDAIISRH